MPRSSQQSVREITDADKLDFPYTGWRLIIFLAGEIREDERNIFNCNTDVIVRYNKSLVSY